MKAVGQEGRTVLFVSHNMTAVKRLCEQALLLQGGHVEAHGITGDVVGNYLSSSSPTVTIASAPTHRPRAAATAAIATGTRADCAEYARRVPPATIIASINCQP